MTAHEDLGGGGLHCCTHHICPCKAREIAELRSQRDEAVGLLRKVSRNGWGKQTFADTLDKTPLLERIDALLARIGETK